jgi:riboflavin kinase/FMN adenylyltransferase
LDFSGDLYGETALVSFVRFIRGEERFASAKELVARMHLDVLEARTLLQRSRPGEMDRRVGAAWASAFRDGRLGFP